MKEKARKILSKFFDSLPLDQHRKYVGSSVDQGDHDFYMVLFLAMGFAMRSYGLPFLAVIGLGFLLHILNFLAWRAEPLHHKAMRNKQ